MNRQEVLNQKLKKHRELMDAMNEMLFARPISSQRTLIGISDLIHKDERSYFTRIVDWLKMFPRR